MLVKDKEYDDGIRRLLRVLRSGLFKFVVITYNREPIINDVFNTLSLSFPNRSIELYSVKDAGLDPHRGYVQLLDKIEHTDADVLLLSYFQYVLQSGWYSDFNHTRDRIARGKCSVVVFISFDELAELRQKLPDWWSFCNLCLNMQSGWKADEGISGVELMEKFTVLRTTLSRPAIEKEIARIEKRLVDVQGDYNLCNSLLSQLYKLYLSLQEYDKAIATSQHRQKLASEAGDNDTFLEALAFEGRAYAESRNYTSALRILESALQQAEKVYGLNHPYYVNVLLLQAYAYDEAGISKHAKTTYTKVLGKLRILYNKFPQVYADGLVLVLNNLGILLNNKKEYKEAEKLFDEALEISRSSDLFQNIAMSLNNKGLLQVRLKEYDQAEELFNEEMAILNRLVKENPQEYLPNLAMVWNNLGLLQSELEQYAKAEKSYLEALDIRRYLNNDNHKTYTSELVSTLNNLGALYCKMHEYGAAEALFVEALQISGGLDNEYPSSHLQDVALCLNNLGSSYMGLHEYQKAEESYSKALEYYNLLGDEKSQSFFYDITTTQLNLSKLYQNSLSNREKSVQLAQEVINNLYPIRTQHLVKEDIEQAYEILRRWGVNPDDYVKEKFGA
jgi:tetratricopeptide (TPR) repeat protein